MPQLLGLKNVFFIASPSHVEARPVVAWRAIGLCLAMK
jgi:hypothetical protein